MKMSHLEALFYNWWNLKGFDIYCKLSISDDLMLDMKVTQKRI